MVGGLTGWATRLSKPAAHRGGLPYLCESGGNSICRASTRSKSGTDCSIVRKQVKGKRKREVWGVGRTGMSGATTLAAPVVIRFAVFVCECSQVEQIHSSTCRGRTEWEKRGEEPWGSQQRAVTSNKIHKSLGTCLCLTWGRDTHCTCALRLGWW